MSLICEVVDSRYIRVRSEGVVTGEDVLEMTRHVYDAHGSSGLARFQLWDHTGLQQIADLPTVMIRAISQLDRSAAALLSDVTIAMVCPNDLLFGLGRMYEAMTEDPSVTTGVFRNAIEAEKWLLARLEA